MAQFEFISPDDKAALLALNTPDIFATAHTLVIELGYKLHQVTTHEEFSERFTQVQYELVLLEDTFGPGSQQNASLITLQGMQMNRRRHATIILFGDRFETMNALQAYQQSVHAVVNKADLVNLKPIIQQVVADNAMFLNVFKDVQARLAQGKR